MYNNAMANAFYDPDDQYVKVCTKCGDCKLALENFGKHKKYGHDGLRGECKACIAAQSRALYYRDIEKNRAKARRYVQSGKARQAIRRNEMRRKYGLTPEQVDAMKESRRYQCDICAAECPNANRGPGQLHIDHCHRTGVVRGMLCGPCNKALGLFKDDTARMRVAIAYLEASRCKAVA